MENLKNPTFIFLITVFTCIFAGAFTSANAQTNEISINLKDFDKLEIGSAFVIDVSKSSQFSIKAKGNKENLDEIESYVKNGELQIKYKDNKWKRQKNGTAYQNFPDGMVYLYITMPELQGVTFSGATKSTIEGFSVKGTFNLSLSGASESKISLKAESIDISLSGASKARISGGNAAIMMIDISGASALDTYEYEAKKINISASGASSAKISVSSYLNADANGASSIRYRGNPDVNSDSSGASRISKD